MSPVLAGMFFNTSTTQEAQSEGDPEAKGAGAQLSQLGLKQGVAVERPGPQCVD